MFTAAIARAELTATFEIEKEFPNYFLPEQYRTLEPAQVPDSVVFEQERKLNAALQSLFERLTIPIVRDGETKPSMVRYFEHLEGELRKIDPSVNVRPSGGVVRSAIGYLYAEMYEGARQRPPIRPDDVFQRIIDGKDDVPGHTLRGIGSDFDVLLLSEPRFFDKLQKRAAQITNSVETLYKAREFKGGIKRSVFTVGDVKQYDEQTQRSTRQGGATIDFLAHDMHAKKMIEPQGYHGIVRKMLLGLYEYIAPATGVQVEDGAKQTVRGLRPMIELPFLKMENEDVFRQEIAAMRKDLSEGKKPSGKAMEQYDKAVRNARFSGAHNRILRGKEGSLEKEIENLNREIESAAQRSTVPEFVDSFPIPTDGDPHARLKGLPSKLLMPLSDFIANHTDKGILYHGTPNVENGLAILRGGLFVSKEHGRIAGANWTMAAFGRGGYSSPHKATSIHYAGANGIVFELQVRTDKPLHVLDWNAVKDTAEIKAIIERAQKEERDVFEVLARDHGIDFIIHFHTLIQNVDAISLPRDIRGIVHAYGTVLENPKADAKAHLTAFTMYRQLAMYAEAMGDRGIKAPPTLDAFRDWLLAHSNDKVAAMAELFNNTEFGEEAKASTLANAKAMELWRTALSEDLNSALEPKKALAVSQVIQHLDPKESSNHSLLRTAAAIAEKKREESNISSLLETLSRFYNGPGPGGAFGVNAIPKELDKAALLAQTIYNTPRIKGEQRVEAFRLHSSIRNLAEFVSSSGISLERISEKEFIDRLFSNAPHPYDPFHALIEGHGNLREEHEERVQSDSEYRKRFMKAATEALRGSEYALDAARYIEGYWPNVTPQDSELQRLSYLERVKDQRYTQDWKPVYFFTNPDVITRILLGDEPQYTRLRPALEKVLRQPPTDSADRQILEVVLPLTSQIYARHPQWKRLVEDSIRALPSDEYSPTTNRPLMKAIKTYSPSLWRTVWRESLHQKGEKTRLDWSDPDVRQIVHEAIALGQHPVWRNAVYTAHHRLSHLRHRGFTEEPLVVEQVAEALPRSALKRELQKAYNDYGKHERGAFYALLNAIHEQKLPFIEENGVIYPARMYELWLGNSPAEVVEHLRKPGSELRDKRTLEALAILKEYREDKSLFNAVKTDPAWKARLAEQLLKDWSLPWHGYPFDTASQDDQRLARRLMVNRHPFESQSQADEVEKKRKDLKTNLAPVFRQVETKRTIDSKNIKTFLHLPVDDRTNWVFESALGDPKTRDTVLRRFGTFRPHDSAVRVVMLLSKKGRDTQTTYEKLSRSLLFHQALRKELEQPGIWRSDAQHLSDYPWNLSNELDIETVRVLTESRRGADSELETYARELRRKYQAVKHDYKLKSPSQFERDDFDWQKIPSVEETEKLNDLLARNADEKQVDRVVGKIAGHNPIRFQELFPQSKANALPRGVSNHYRDWYQFDSRYRLNDAMEQLGSIGPLSQEQEDILAHHFKQRDPEFVMALLEQGGGARRRALEFLDQPRNWKLWLELRKLPLNNYGDRPNKETARRLWERPALSEKLFNYVKQNPSKKNVAAFGWNLGQPDQAQWLVDYLKRNGTPASDFETDLYKL